jgi:hypothetical protein
MLPNLELPPQGISYQGRKREREREVRERERDQKAWKRPGTTTSLL